MSTAKGKVILKVFGDFFTVGKNVVKYFKGNPNVSVSSVNAAKNAGKIPKSGTRSSVENASTLGRLKRGAENRKAGEALKKLSKESKVKIKSGTIDAGGAGSRTSGTGGAKISGDKRVNPWSKTNTTNTVKPKTISRQTRKGVVKEEVIPKVKGKGSIIINPFTKKPFTTKAKWLAAGGIGSWATYVAVTSGSKKPNGAASTTPKPKPPKPPTASSTTGPVTTAPAPPSQLPSSPNGKKPKPQQSGPSSGPPQTQATKSEPKTLEQKLKAKFVKFRGGEDAFGKKGSDAAWKTEVLNMREGSEGGYTYTDQQNYDKIIEERKELASASKKKRGGVIKRNKGGPVRGVGKALRGYGNNSIYSNKMY